MMSGICCKMFSFQIIVVFLSSLMITSKCLDFDTVYMESVCGASVSMQTSFQLDSSTGLTYKNQLDCTYSVSAPAGHFVVAIITRFELEPALAGTCTDYVDFHDGSTTAATKLNTDLVCGSGSSIPSNFTSTGQAMTLRFVTDNSGVYLGFGINFVAATSGVCSSSQYTCNTSICIDSSLQCDGHNQCGDSSDENNCTVTTSGDSVNVLMIVVITLVVVAVISVVIALIVYRIHARNKWKKFINMHIDDDDGMVAPSPSYPITHRYYKGVKGHPTLYNTEAKVTIHVTNTDEKTGTGTEINSSNGASKNIEA